MTESAKPDAPPSLGDAIGWIGSTLDAAGGARVGRIDNVFVDADSGEPAWLVATLGQRRVLFGRRGNVRVAIPARDCAGGAGCVWTAHESEALRGAPVVDSTRALLREHELTICAHYGIGERVGRAAEVAGRPEGSITAQPA